MIYTLSGDTDKILASMRKISTLIDSNLLNVKVVRNLQAEYLSAIREGATPPVYEKPIGDESARALQRRLSSRLQLPSALVRAYLVSLYTLAREGKIPREWYDPRGAKRAREAKAEYLPTTTERISRMVAQVGAGTAKIVLFLGILGSVLLLAKAKRG